MEKTLAVLEINLHFIDTDIHNAQVRELLCARFKKSIARQQKCLDQIRMLAWRAVDQLARVYP